ncbi:tetratricopeptide repeat protein [Pedobacter alpinus]|uniref:Tetratricopeptide repeat protein n=1 Tax=Pedobacter alpinus TaxID=1590643 RepID=A0ABW5TTT4_9SPHI
MIKGRFISAKFIFKVIFTLSISFLLLNSCKNKTEKYLEKDKYFNDIIHQTIIYNAKYGSKKNYAQLDSIKINDPNINPLFDFYYYRFFASEYLALGKLDSSKYYARKLIPVLNNLGSTESLPTQYSLAYFTLSDISYAKKEYLEAYKYLYLAKNISRANNISFREYNYRIGMILYNQENYILAARSFKRSISFDVKDDVFEKLYRHQEILSNIGLSYYKANQLDSAEYWHQNALKFIDNFKSSEYDKSLTRGCKGVIIGNLGQVFAKKGDYPKAIALLKKSISINDKSQDLAHDAFLQKIHLARIYLTLSNFKELDLILADTENYLRKNPALKPESDLLKIKADYSIKKEDFKTALSLIKKAENLKFKHNQQEGNFNQINLVEQLQILEKETKLELLKKQNEVKSIYLIGTIILTLLSFVILILIYNYWSKSKKTVKTLNTLNKKIKEQSMVSLHHLLNPNELLKMNQMFVQM